MPNWCENYVEISGLRKIVEQAESLVQGENGVFDFGKIVPEPKNQPDYDWFAWRNKNWGTKWNACEVRKEDCGDADRIAYRFCTAWGPPEKVLHQLSRMFPSVRILHAWAEPSEDFAGIRVYYPCRRGNPDRCSVRTIQGSVSDLSEKLEAYFDLSFLAGEDDGDVLFAENFSGELENQQEK